MQISSGSVDIIIAVIPPNVSLWALLLLLVLQVTGLSTKYHYALAWAGRIGWVGKAVVYAMIGGLACQFASSGYTPDPNLPETEQISASPQVSVPCRCQ